MATVKERVEVFAEDPSEIPGKQLACRQHHPWPSENMVDSRVLPPGLYAIPAPPAVRAKHPGMWWLVDQCPRCGCIRYQDMPEGKFVNGPWKRKYDKNWLKVKLASGEKFTSRSALEENMARNAGKFSKFFQLVAESQEVA